MCDLVNLIPFTMSPFIVNHRSLYMFMNKWEVKQKIKKCTSYQEKPKILTRKISTGHYFECTMEKHL